jgi:hypothetical protein
LPRDMHFDNIERKGSLHELNSCRIASRSSSSPPSRHIQHLLGLSGPPSLPTIFERLSPYYSKCLDRTLGRELQRPTVERNPDAQGLPKTQTSARLQAYHTFMSMLPWSRICGRIPLTTTNTQTLRIHTYGMQIIYFNTGKTNPFQPPPIECNSNSRRRLRINRT